MVWKHLQTFPYVGSLVRPKSRSYNMKIRRCEGNKAKKRKAGKKEKERPREREGTKRMGRIRKG